MAKGPSGRKRLTKLCVDKHIKTICRQSRMLIITDAATHQSMTLTSKPDVDFVEIGEIVTLNCQVKSKPPADLEWVLVLVSLMWSRILPKDAFLSFLVSHFSCDFPAFFLLIIDYVVG